MSRDAEISFPTIPAMTPANEIMTPSTWRRRGFFFRTRVDASIPTKGIKAFNAALSEAVVRWTPRNSVIW